MAAPNWADKTIWTGDCLDIMRGMNSATVDLIYLDPPFNSNANYAAPIGSQAAGAAFKDTWSLSDVDAEWINLIETKHPALHRVLLAAMSDSDKAYLAYMAARLLEMPRILKPTGSIYLHCDPTMSHYLKLLMDAVFGHGNFRNEIVWCYRGGGAPRSDFGRRHDVILRYSIGQPYHFDGDAVRIPYEAEGQGRTDDSMWGRHRGTTKVYKPHPLGKIPEDWWPMNVLNANSPERTGYPTQKPLALLRRIVAASSPAEGVVLDPFCGCATACVAADLFDRQWVGIDISPKAVELVNQRLQEPPPLGIGPMFHHGYVTVRDDIPQRSDLGPLPAPRTHRATLYGLQEGNCTGCNVHFEARHLEVDHIIARASGGTDHIDNLQLLCGSCNRIKGDRGMEYLRVKLQLQ